MVRMSLHPLPDSLSELSLTRLAPKVLLEDTGHAA